MITRVLEWRGAPALLLAILVVITFLALAALADDQTAAAGGNVTVRGVTQQAVQVR
jgi:hypothetical protein